MRVVMTSSAFAADQEIPKVHTGDGRDVSPPLVWGVGQSLPSGIKSWALICDDPDAPMAEPFVHWVIYNIPGEARELPQGVHANDRLDVPRGAVQGTNSFGSTGYRGPKPPPGNGWHHYHFKIFGLDLEPSLKAGLTKDSLQAVMKSHILTEGNLIGIYKR